MFITKLYVDFVIFSVIGWIYECIYCTIKGGHWENRGFLFGPACPIYGVGAVLASLLFVELPKHFGLPPFSIPQVFLLCFIGSAVLEYLTSYFLEKCFHAVWWDYHDMPLNLHGRICLPASLFFGIAGVILVRYIFPITTVFFHAVPHPFWEIFSLISVGFLGADLALSAAEVSSLLEKISEIEEELNQNIENAYQIMGSKPKAVASKVQAAGNIATRHMIRLTRRQILILWKINRFSSKSITGISEKMKSVLRSLPIRARNMINLDLLRGKNDENETEN